MSGTLPTWKRAKGLLVFALFTGFASNAHKHHVIDCVKFKIISYYSAKEFSSGATSFIKCLGLFFDQLRFTTYVLASCLSLS